MDVAIGHFMVNVFKGIWERSETLQGVRRKGWWGGGFEGRLGEERGGARVEKVAMYIWELLRIRRVG